MKSFRKSIPASDLIYHNELENCHNSPNQCRLRRDLYGLPLDSEMKSEDLHDESCWLLGSTMLNCIDYDTKLPIWSYQRVDLGERQRVRKTAELRRNLRNITVPFGLTRGHLSTMKFCVSDLDAKASCNRKNIVVQTDRQNNECCKMWEDDVEKRILKEKFIAHITTVVVYEENAKEQQHSMYKILVEEHAGQSLSMKCFLIYDVHDDFAAPARYKRISYTEAIKKTGLDFLNSSTSERLRLNNLIL